LKEANNDGNTSQSESEEDEFFEPLDSDVEDLEPANLHQEKELEQEDTNQTNFELTGDQFTIKASRKIQANDKQMS
jgi:hypothetical protein